jgi:hypothetical protein
MINTLPDTVFAKNVTKPDIINLLTENITQVKGKKIKNFNINDTIYTTENSPKRGKPLERYNLYKDGITIKDLLENEEITKQTLQYDLDRNYIEINNKIIENEIEDESEIEESDNDSDNNIDEEEIVF